MEPAENANAPAGYQGDALKRTSGGSYHGLDPVQVWQGWGMRAAWALNRYRRTGKPRDWLGYVTLVAAIAERRRRWRG